MKVKITENKEESLLSRNRVDAELEFDKAVPSRKEVIEAIAVHVHVKPDLVVVRKIENEFGKHKAKVYAYAYKNKESRDKIAEKKVLAKIGYNIPKIEKKAAAPAAPAK